MSGTDRKKRSHHQKAVSHQPENIVVTGVSDFLGGSILKILERHEYHRKLIGIDRRPPAFTFTNSEYVEMDLAERGIERRLRKLLDELGPNTTIVHAALPWEPVREEQYAHQLMLSGSLAVLRSAKQTGVRKLVLASTTDVYGAFANNPNYIPEDSEPRGGSQSFYLQNRIYVEEMFRKFHHTNKNSVVTILRPCTILGSTVVSFKTNFLRQDVIPVALGFDPLMQFIHESDVLRAFLIVIERDAPGIYNIVGDGVMPFSRALRLLNKTSVPMPAMLLSLFADIAWGLDMGFAPAKHIAFLKYPCVADGEKARRDLGFVPVYTSQETVLSFVGNEQEPIRLV